MRYQEYLEKTQEDADSRWRNVQELVTFASEMESELGAQSFEVDVEDTEVAKEDEDWQDREEDEHDEEELDDLGFAEVKPKDDKQARKGAESEDAAA